MGRFDEFGNGFGLHGFDPHGQSEGPLVTRGVLREPARGWHHDEPPYYAPQQQPPPPSPPYAMREHGGFSNYAGGGNRDRDRDREREREYFARSHNPYGGRANASWYGAPHQAGGGGYGDPGWSPATHSRYTQSHYQQPQGYGYGTQGSDMGIGERLSDDRGGPFYGRGPKGYKRSDERIREEVCEMIARQGYVDASDVEVKVDNGVVCLVGTVAQRHDKRALEQMADRVHGVEEVRNELRLQQTRHLPHQMPTQQFQPQPLQQQQPPTPNNGKNGRV